MQISKKLAFTASSQIQSIITKLLNERMIKVCEMLGYFASTQCIFFLPQALTESRKKKYNISVAFFDLTKAYDSVNQELE